jgi:hypothetical protein
MAVAPDGAERVLALARNAGLSPAIVGRLTGGEPKIRVGARIDPLATT